MRSSLSRIDTVTPQISSPSAKFSPNCSPIAATTTSFQTMAWTNRIVLLSLFYNKNLKWNKKWNLQCHLFDIWNARYHHSDGPALPIGDTARLSLDDSCNESEKKRVVLFINKFYHKTFYFYIVILIIGHNFRVLISNINSTEKFYI